MSHRQFKDRIYEQFERLGAALASARRIEIIDLLAQAPRHVEALASEMEQSVANVSQHLQALRNAGLVEAERSGNRVVYRLAEPAVANLWLALRSVGERRLAEVDRIRREFGLEGEEHVLRHQLRKQVRQAKVVLLDVRPKAEYSSGHIPGAVSMPPDELPHRLGELPRDKKIVAYCRGNYCLFADEAVNLLKKEGFDAVRLDGGWLEWMVETALVSNPQVHG